MCVCVFSSVCVRALEVTVSQSSVQVARGQAAVLPCTFTTSAALNNLYIIWMVTPLANANQPEQVIIYQGGQVFSLANHMNGRVGFVSIMPSTSASIFINNTQLSDTGTYQCLVNNLPDRGGRNIGVIGLTVLGEQSLTHMWPWTKKSLKSQPQSVGLIAGTIATGILALIICSLLVLVTLFYWRNKNRYEEEEIPNEIREDDLPPKRSSSVKAFQADASSSENDTLTSTNTYNSRYWHNPKPTYDSSSYTRYNGDTRQTFSAPYANGSHTLPPPKTLVVTTNSAPSPPVMARSNGSLSLRPPHTHTHSYAVSQATLERMGAVPVMVPAQSKAGSLV
uniref:Immunoglobulin superfamily member 11 n=1 Tax=Cyprinus carpio TaxID=7962 RepID=A0A8C2DXH1_CYPCA